MTHANPCVTDDCENGDVANDSYNQYERDVEMMRELGLDMYRFSLSWSRLLPTSFPDKINQAGVDYYNNLINEMLKYNIKPMVTLYHWDLPQKLQEMGGWANPHMVDWFSDYARVAFELFGDRVKHWITMNEPREVCYQGYGIDTKAPQLNISGYAEYLCAKNLLVSHARAYHIYDQEYRPTQQGTIGITLSAHWYAPETESEADAVLAEEVRQFEVNMFLISFVHRIFLFDFVTYSVMFFMLYILVGPIRTSNILRNRRLAFSFENEGSGKKCSTRLQKVETTRIYP